MARKTRKRAARTASVPLSNAELIARVRKEAPEFLKLKVPEAGFGAVVDNLLTESPSDERPHFYCRPCGQYHEKTHPHHADMKRRKRKARRQKARKAG
jgi:hypothetical protein